MTISSTTNRLVFAGPGNGFAYNKPVFAQSGSDVYVLIEQADGTLLEPTLGGGGTYDFNISGSYDAASFRYPAGVTVTLNNALPTGWTIAIECRPPNTQTSDYTDGGPLPAERLETDLDRLVVQMQAVQSLSDDAVRIAATASGFSNDPIVPVGDRLVGFNAGGTGFTLFTPNADTYLTIPLPVAQGGTGATTILGAQQALNLEPGVDVQAYDADTTKNDVNNAFTATQRWAKGADVASASALTLGTGGNYFDVTGTTTITSIATVGIGTWVCLHFDAALTLTHHATDLILPGGANITTAAGDEAIFIEYASGDWRCVSYTKANGEAVVGGGTTLGTPNSPSGSAQVDYTGLPSGVARIEVSFVGLSFAAGANLLIQLGDSGGIETTGYDSISNQQGAANTTSTSGFVGLIGSAAAIFSGSFVMRLMDPANNTWVCEHIIYRSDTTNQTIGVGTKSLSSELTQIRIGATTGNFDAGALNILYQ